MNNEEQETSHEPIEKETITSMHEVTPLDKETQEGLEDVEVGDIVPMVPDEGNGDKHLRPDLAE